MSKFTRKHLRAAVENVAKYGDTDVFPFPIENHIFFDKPSETVDLLENIHKTFDETLKHFPLVHESTLSVVGYTGFRWASQIDPFWNAYLLALVISIGSEIEKARVPRDKGIVFSYRFKPDQSEKTLFDKSIGWIEFQKASVDAARAHSFVLVTDISDFYPRIYHHRLENALKRATTNTEVVRRIMELLVRISKGVSYGLPVGGPAARILSELVLNRVDRLLLAEGFAFRRFVDEYHIYAETREQAYAHLVSLSNKLLENEGLSLQKQKTRIMTSQEFLTTSQFAKESIPEDAQEVSARDFLSLRLHYDPYSPTAEEDYETLRSELNKFDILGMLARELQKSRLDQTLTKRLIKSIEYLETPIRNDALLSLTHNLKTLYPVFPTVMLLFKALVGSLEPATRAHIFDVLRDLIKQGSYITMVPVNLAFAVRVLAHDDSDETDEVLAETYRDSTSMLLRRDLILIMARRNADYWISERRKYFYTLTPWERRSLIVASYILEDEGKHWRDSIRSEIGPTDTLVMEWAAQKKQSGSWEIPV